MASSELDLDRLATRLARLEGLVLALLVSDYNDTNDPELDEAMHLLLLRRKSYRSDPMDREFSKILEHFVRSRPGRVSRQIESLIKDVGQQADDIRKEVRHLIDNSKARISEVCENLHSELEILRPKIERLEDQGSGLSAELHSTFALQSLGVDVKDAAMQRYLPLRVYLSDGTVQKVESVSKALSFLSSEFGFEVSDDFPPERGSWWKKWFVRTKDAVIQPEVTERLMKLERALELQGLDKPQSEVTKNQADAVAALISSIKDVPEAAIQVGNILLLKTSQGSSAPCLQVRTLSQSELAYLEQNQKILANPGGVLEALSNDRISINYVDGAPKFSKEISSDLPVSSKAALKGRNPDGRS